MQTLTIPIKSPKELPKLVFPQTCLNCGQPKAGTRGISLDVSPSSSKRSIFLELEPPLCTACIALENRLEWFSLLTFTISAFVLGGLTFLVLFLFLPVSDLWDWLGIETFRRSWLASTTLAGAGALLVAVVGGTVTELVVKTLASTWYGRLLAARPLTIFSLLSESQDVVGLRAQLTPDKKALVLTFEQDAIAAEFVVLNGLVGKD